MRHSLSLSSTPTFVFRPGDAAMRRACGACRVFTIVAILGVLAGGLAATSRGQSEGGDAALKDRVAQLVERLEDPKPEARDEAQARLVKLGARILPLLPPADAVAGKERKERLGKGPAGPPGPGGGGENR